MRKQVPGTLPLAGSTRHQEPDRGGGRGRRRGGRWSSLQRGQRGVGLAQWKGVAHKEPPEAWPGAAPPTMGLDCPHKRVPLSSSRAEQVQEACCRAQHLLGEPPASCRPSLPASSSSSLLLLEPLTLPPPRRPAIQDGGLCLFCPCLRADVHTVNSRVTLSGHWEQVRGQAGSTEPKGRGPALGHHGTQARRSPQPLRPGGPCQGLFCWLMGERSEGHLRGQDLGALARGLGPQQPCDLSPV